MPAFTTKQENQFVLQYLRLDKSPLFEKSSNSFGQSIFVFFIKKGLTDFFTLELSKNPMIQINKTASNVHFNEAEIDREINFSTTLLTKGRVHYSSLHNRVSKILRLNTWDLYSN
ncbi:MULTISPECIES: hypothetical protein [Leptospira]|uniref:hypothetical protein n=2 Tax=Leptospiraceae TaxID=170 RepID=UPI000346789F|nr:MULTISPECIES: hypothetical protein [Leptospira]OMI18818.1 hypothetical protein BUQ74_02700 [Leptospira weilii serovar Heyan]